MWVFGLGYFSQHKTVAAIPSGKYQLHYFLPREKPKKIDAKKKKTVTEAVAPPPDLLYHPVVPAAADTPDPMVMLHDFIKMDSDKKKVLLVAGMNSIFPILKTIRKNRKAFAGMIVFDNPSNLFDYDIPIVDAERVREGVWWKKKSFLETDLGRSLKEFDAGHKFKLKRLKKIRRILVSNPEQAPSAKAAKETEEQRERGFLHAFVKEMDAIIGKSPKRDKIYHALMGYLAGVEKKSHYQKILKILNAKFAIDASLIKRFEKFMYSKAGSDLFCVFYYHAKGQSFRGLQGGYKHLNMDDWLTLTEWVSATEKHRFYTKPSK